MIALRDIAPCFEGLVPATMATCSLEGEPNVTKISQVKLVDDRHVALSHQFFNKTQRNVRENPQACVVMHDPGTFEVYRLEVRFDHSETEGPLFEEMAAQIQVIASHTGMLGIFKLRCADVYEVLAVEHVKEFFLPPDPRIDVTRPPAPNLEAMARELHGLQAVSDRVNRTGCLEELLEGVLDELDCRLGIPNSMVLLPDGKGSLVATASHGYGQGGVGAEVPLGEGLIGTVAARRRPMRVAGVGAELRYWRAIKREMEQSGAGSATAEIPLPGLPDAQSQLALPLLVGDGLLGVLALESRDPMAFDAWTETFLKLLANQVALGISRVQENEDDEGTLEAASDEGTTAGRPLRNFQLFKNDDCIFVDGEYLIRNVPAKILWKLLKAHKESGRVEFTNRELRLDPTLGLPALKDNLESRLILLRKRLEEKCNDIRLVPVRRGRFALRINCPVKLEERESSA